MPRAQAGPSTAAGSQPVELPELPDGDHRKPTLLAGLVLAIGGIWIAVPLLALVTGARLPLPGLGVAGACGLLAVGVGQTLWGLDLLLRRQTLIIGRDCLQVSVRGLLGARSWSEPLANYRGLRHRRERVRHRYGWRVAHRLQLAHPDPTKRIDLVTTRDDRRIALARREWAQLLDMPVWPADDAGGRWRALGTGRRRRPDVDVKGVPSF